MSPCPCHAAPYRLTAAINQSPASGRARPLRTPRLPRPRLEIPACCPNAGGRRQARSMPGARAGEQARFPVRPNRIAPGRRQSPLPDPPPARSPMRCLKAGRRDAPDATKAGRALPSIRSTQRRLTDTTTQRQAARTVRLKAEPTPRTRRIPCRARTGDTWHDSRPAGWA